MKLKRRILILTIIFTLLLSSTAHGAITFKNIGNPYGTVNALAYVNNHLICFCENGMILTSGDEGMSLKTHQFGQYDDYRNFAIYKNTVIGYNQRYGKNIAVSSDSLNWSAFNMSENIALITSGADGFILITKSGKLYTSKTGMENTWKLQYTVILPDDTRNIYYLDKTDAYVVVAYHNLYTTKDFKNYVPITLSDKDVTLTSATITDQFIYIINENTSSVQVFDYNLNLKDTYPQLFVNDMKIYPVSLYNNAGKVGYITSNKGVYRGDKVENSYLVDQNGAIVVDTGTILGAYLGNSVVINNKVFIGDPESGLVRVDLATKKTDLLFSSTKYPTTLQYINDKIILNNGEQLYTLNSNLQKEVIIDFNSSILGSHYIGLYKNGETYTIEYEDGRRFTSSDLKSWTAIQHAHAFGFKKVINFNNHLMYTRAGNIFVDYNGSGDDFRMALNTKDIYFEKLLLDSKSALVFLETNFAEGDITYTDSIIFNNNAYFAARNGKVTVVDKNLNCKRYDFESTNLYDVQMKVINNKLFIVADGVIYTSSDGEKWTKLKSNGLGRAKDITYGKGTYVIVGHSGSIMESTDLVNWKKIDSGYKCQFEQVMFDEEKFIIVSSEGIILVSTSITAEQTSQQRTQQSAIHVTVNGSPVLFPDVTPFLDKNNRTQVPVRFVAEALGGSVKWISNTQTVVIEKNGDTILFKINENAYSINGKKVSVDSSSTLKGSRTFVPLRFVSEALGATVKWNAATNTVEISK
ncbi:MAG TPA: copper amine oxidase N-terminal domain-containing protein [Pseudobacteroides sp.]|uniref:copper amine oxidase N-terminal domain-containing protein n=1 Tax=Pseudobacteroides sp. TaxID=1968840 RepID=UPI002F9382FA